MSELLPDPAVFPVTLHHPVDPGTGRRWVVTAPRGGRAGSSGRDLQIGERLRALRAQDVLVVVGGGRDSSPGPVLVADPRLCLLQGPEHMTRAQAVMAGLRFAAAQGSPTDIVCELAGGIGAEQLAAVCAAAAPGRLGLVIGPVDGTGDGGASPERVLGQLRSLRIGMDLGTVAARAMCLADFTALHRRIGDSPVSSDIELALAAQEMGLAIEVVTTPGPIGQPSPPPLELLSRRELVGLRRKYHLVSGPLRTVEDEEPTGNEGPPSVLSRRQVVALAVGLAALAGALVIAPLATVIAVNVVLISFFMAANLMKLVLIQRGATRPSPILVHGELPARWADQDLPIYTVLLPVYRESSVLHQLVEGIENLDYPMDRLDVKLLLEESDDETRGAVASMELPDCFEVLIIPDVGPTGKPRACNHGLSRARGKYLVIYDAEDVPDADQLRRSVAAFERADPNVVCLQAKLNYFNRAYNLLTRWFTAEYSVWFDQLLPGLQALDVAIPLGGTSNHFIRQRLAELGGWNAYNVTEDADLGMRIYLRGWQTAILDSTTYEEATSRYRNWVRQRSRWSKGYMQTYLFFMRHPVALVRSMGALPFVAFQLFFGANTLCLLLNPVYWALVLWWFAFHAHFVEQIFPRPIFYVGLFGLFVGNAACVLSMVSGCYARHNYEDVKYALLSPLYWLLMSVASYKALIQLCYKPSYWEKTEHGFCTVDAAESGGTGPTPRFVPAEPVSAEAG